MRVLVAGGHGFIGRRVAEILTERGHDVLVGGRGDTEQLAKGGADAVVWAAGGRVSRFEDGLDVHVQAPQRVLEASGATRIVYLGSGESYGLQDVPFREATPLRGTSPYSRAKIAGEEAVAAKAKELGAGAYLLRLGVVFGPGQKGQMLIPALLSSLLQRRRFPMTRGDQTRDVIYVDDVVRLIARCLDDDAPAGIYNGGRGVEVPVIDVVTRVVEVASRHLGVDLMPLLDAGAVPYRDGEQMRYVFDVSRAKELLGWAPEVDIDDGIERTVEAVLAGAARE